jgi:hypothetical protein
MNIESFYGSPSLEREALGFRPPYGAGGSRDARPTLSSDIPLVSLRNLLGDLVCGLKEVTSRSGPAMFEFFHGHEI